MRFPIIEGFDYYSDTFGANAGSLPMAWNNYTTIPSQALVTGLGGDGKALQLGTSGSQSGYSRAIPDSQLLTIHFAYKHGPLYVNANIEMIQLATADGSHQCGLQMDISGRWNLIGEGNAVVAQSTFAGIPGQVYRCVWQVNLLTGYTRLSVNGDDDAGFHQTGLDLQDHPTIPYVQQFRLHQNGGLDTTVDDLIVGIDECVDWGPQEIAFLPASADVLAQWTRSAGANNFDNVNDLPVNGDTDYNYATVVGNKDVFEFDNPPRVPNSILAVQLLTYARKEESAVRKFRELLRIGGVDYNGTEHNLSENWGQYTSVWVNNPATGVAWTASELNALQGGYELTVVS